MKLINRNYISLDKFINKALYQEDFGLYMKKNPIGKYGDFITAPNISILFSEMIAIWIISFWEKLNFPKKINIIELGAGNGEMIYQMASSFKNFNKFDKSYNLFIFEKSPLLKKIQKNKLKDLNIRWIDSLDYKFEGPKIFLANEFFDSLPIKQYLKKNGVWFERYVDISKKNELKFKEIKLNMKKMEKKIGFRIAKNQNFIEYSPLSFAYLKKISKQIKNENGGLLIIDYGYLNYKMIDTLQCIKKHKEINIFKDFGEADITYNINFRLIEKMINKLKLKSQGITTQSEFLTKLGIKERAEIICKNLSFSRKTDVYYRLKRLIDKKEMGDLFKVMLITNKKINFRIGF
mgnify:CR=1 FL=1